jgi:hypothetical protein
VREHAAEFHAADDFFQIAGIAFDAGQGVVVAFLACHVEQLARIPKRLVQPGQGVDDVFQFTPFLAQFLCFFGIVPDGRVFQQLDDFSQALLFDIVVKDTPEGPGCASSGQPGGFLWH